MPTVPDAAAASLDLGPPPGWPSVPTAGVMASKRDVERHLDGVRLGLGLGPALAAGAGRDGVVHGEAPGLEGFEHLVADGADLEVAVDHLALLLDEAVLAELAARQPQRHADVHRPLVGPDPDAGEEPRVAPGVIGVEVVRLAPGGVAFDGVGEVVAGVEDRHALHHRLSGADIQRLAGDAPGGVGEQPADGGRDLVGRLEAPEWDLAGDVGGQAVGAAHEPLEHGVLVDEVGVHRARADGVDGDALGPELESPWSGSSRITPAFAAQ